MSIRFTLPVLFLLAALVGCSKTNEKRTDVVEEESARANTDTDETPDSDASADARPEEKAPNAQMANAALQQFGTKLYQELNQGNENDNLAISPWSVESALVMVAAGAKGHTLAQMLYTLGFVHIADDPDAMQTSFSALSKQLLESANKAADDDEDAADENNDLILHAANAIWVADHLRKELRPAFETGLKEHHAAEVHEAPFKENADDARKAINQWVAKNTDDKITELLPPSSVDAMTSIVLTNAIAFDADWTDAFDKKNTKKAPFHLLNGKSVEADLMYREFNRASYWETEDFHAVALPYESGNYAMSIVVPNEGQFDKVRAYLFDNGFESVFVAKDQRAHETVKVYLPRFQFRWKSSLNYALKQLGMENAFDDRADFSKMFKESSHRISDVVHEVYIDVDEEGTEAAAATGAVISVTSVRVDEPKIYEVRADRPFLFAIHEVATNAPIFMGHVTNPKAK